MAGCAWCGATPAFHKVEVEPAQYGNAITANKGKMARTLIRAAIVVYACDQHAHILDIQPSLHPPDPKVQKKRLEAAQTTIFDFVDG